MAIKTYSVLKDMRHPLYLNRMLKAGQALELDAGTANLYQRLGVIGKDPLAPRGTVGGIVAAQQPRKAPRRAAPKKKVAKKAK
jgi:hypothetical protein